MVIKTMYRLEDRLTSPSMVNLTMEWWKNKLPTSPWFYIQTHHGLVGRIYFHTAHGFIFQITMNPLEVYSSDRSMTILIIKPWTGWKKV